ncbi:MAG TPA: HAMP domain-containing sensor histidine kinase [Chryseolinea sp.]|nr:HAMP domain-containing sensor histidine kinase [Chryseolinea sp.]
MVNTFQKNIIYFVVILIGSLLLTDILLTRHNNAIIKGNKDLQIQTESIKRYHDQIGRIIIHSLDIGLRGYAISKDESFAKPMDNARAWNDSIFSNVELPLKKLNYEMTTYYALQDSVKAYIEYCYYLKSLLKENKTEEFLKLFGTDKGADLWGQYLASEEEILAFTKKVAEQAELNYQTAMGRNQTLQIVLFLICFPTLLYTAYYTGKTFRLTDLLREAEADKNKILTELNTNLEHSIAARTQEIAAQHEEMISQSEELAAQHDALSFQNKQLFEAQKIIEGQNLQIQQKNEELEQEIEKRTQELQNTNRELVVHNNQLEQFAFIVAHNLRAPLARILGLANVVELSKTLEDKDVALKKIVTSTQDLDQVIRDLNLILNIQKHTSNLVSVDLTDAFKRVLKMLEKEIDETRALVIKDFSSADKVYAVAPYVESILYNLLSNAIKYRDPTRIPIITLTTEVEPDFVCLVISDNGLGINLGKYKQNMFTLYRRFHTHMEGKGLGLYLVKTQITALGGKIDVESELDKGTIFKVYFKY